MATSSPMNRMSSGLAGAPTRFAGGVRRRDENPQQFRDRMDAGYARDNMAAMPTETRQDRIIAARMDGSFDSKRNAFNQANAGKLGMDEAGNIAPITPTTQNLGMDEAGMTTPPAKVTPPPQPGGQLVQGTAPGSYRWMPTQPAGQPPQPATMSPRDTAAAQAKGAAGRERARARIAAEHAQNLSPEQKWAKNEKTWRDVKNWRDSLSTYTKTPGSPGTPILTQEQQDAMATAARVNHQAWSDRQNAPERAKLQAEQKSQAEAAANAKAFGDRIMAKVDQQLAANKPSGVRPPAMAPKPTAAPTPAPAPAPARLDAAQMQAQKNPQGLSARFNRPGTPPVTWANDPLNKNIVKPLAAAGSALGGAVNRQAARNPQGLAAKLQRFASGTSTPTTPKPGVRPPMMAAN